MDANDKPHEKQPVTKLSIVRAQVFFLLSTLSEDKWATTVKQLRELADQNPPEIYHHLLRRLIQGNASEIFELNRPVENGSTKKLLLEEMADLASDPLKAVKFRDALIGYQGDIFKDFDFAKFVQYLQFSEFETHVLALSLLSSNKPDIIQKGKSFIMARMNDLLDELKDLSKNTTSSADALFRFVEELLSTQDGILELPDIRKRSLIYAFKKRLEILEVKLKPEWEEFFQTIESHLLSTEGTVAPANESNQTLDIAATNSGTPECMDRIMELLVSSGPLTYDAMEFIQQEFSRYPELIFLAAVQLPVPWHVHHDNLVARGFDLFFSGHPSFPLVFTKLAEVNWEYLSTAFAEYYLSNTYNITRIFDISQKSGQLTHYLGLKPTSLTLDLAAFTSRKISFDLDSWLQMCISNECDDFIKAMLDFLNDKAKAKLDEQQEISSANSTIGLQIKTVGMMLKVLMTATMSPENAVIFKAVQIICLQAYPRLVLIDQDFEVYDGPEAKGFAPEIEKEVEVYYQRYFREEMTVDDMIVMLGNFRSSDNVRDRDFFACMLHYLFDEYRFLKNEYPQKAVEETGVLFGSIIEHSLITYIPLGIALRYVLEALQEPRGAKMFNFAVKALYQFKSRLYLWPQYRSQILSITSLAEDYPDLVNYIRQGENAADSGATYPNRQIFSSLAFEFFEDNDCEEPDDSLKDNVLFMLNNLSQSNISAKAKDIYKLLEGKFYDWFASHLVSQRATLEPNNHGLYNQLLNMFNDRHLDRHIFKETYSAIVALMNAESTVSSSADRLHLKSLASWLGGLTLSQNKPILHNNIAFKEMLLEGYDNNKLILVIPFTREALKHAAESLVFKPPNPWIMGILKLLRELYLSADLKMNLQFEVECLCRDLEVDLQSIEPSTDLCNRPERKRHEQTMLELKRYREAVGTGDLTPELTDVQMRVDSIHLGADGVAANPQDITNHLVFVGDASIFKQHAGLRKIFVLATEAANRDVLAQVMDRTVTTACISTRDFVLKDFALEENEEKLREAAHYMVYVVSGHLALVFSRELLRSSMTQTIQTYLLQSGYNEQMIPEAAITTAVNDNLPFGLSILQRAIQERAELELDELLADAVTARRRHREYRPRQPFFDQNISRYALSFPDPLRLKQTGLDPQQFAIYEDFTSMPISGMLMSPTTFHVNPAARQRQPHRDRYAERIDHRTAPSRPRNVTIAGLVRELSELEALTNRIPVMSLAMLPTDHDIRIFLAQIPALVGHSPDRDELAGDLAQRICLILYGGSESHLTIEAFCVILARLCEVSPRTAKNVNNWLMATDDERLYNVPVTIALIRAGIITPVDYDFKFARLISSGSKIAMEFMAELIQQAVHQQPPCAIAADFARCIELLEVANDQYGPPAPQPIEDPSEEYTLLLANDTNIQPISPLNAHLVEIFNHWIKFINRGAVRQDYLKFLFQLEQGGIFEDDELFYLYIRACTEYGIQSFEAHEIKATKSSNEGFAAIDGLAKLVIALNDFQVDVQNSNTIRQDSNLVAKIVSAIVLVFSDQHEKAHDSLNQKPMFRWFSSLFYEISSTLQDPADMKSLVSLNVLISNLLYLLQPLHYPGYTFAWMTLISHKEFLPQIVNLPNNEGWPLYERLLVGLFHFLNTLNEQQPNAIFRAIKEGALRIAIVINHDYPEFAHYLRTKLQNHGALVQWITPTLDFHKMG